MDVHAALEIARKLREVTTMGDYGYDKSHMILELLALADDYQEVAESIEAQMFAEAN